MAGVSPRRTRRRAEISEREARTAAVAHELAYAADPVHVTHHLISVYGRWSAQRVIYWIEAMRKPRDDAA